MFAAVTNDDSNPFGRDAVATAVVVESLLGALALALGYLFGIPAAATLRWDAGALLAGVAATAPMLAVFVAFMIVDLAPLRTIRDLLDRFVGMVFARATWLHVAVVSLAAGLGEELLFRGFLQGALEHVTGVVPALALASVAFGLAHAVTPTYVVIATAFGAYFGWLWLATGNLLTVVAAHAVYDFVALTVMIRAHRRLPDVHGPIAT
jgi:membrane protease YdiL (CAAX protease family)